jgi:hypothetical protein
MKPQNKLTTRRRSRISDLKARHVIVALQLEIDLRVRTGGRIPPPPKRWPKKWEEIFVEILQNSSIKIEHVRIGDMKFRG